MEGPITKRKDAVTNQDLWNLSGQQSITIIRCNRDKEILRQMLIEPPKEKKRWWKFW